MFDLAIDSKLRGCDVVSLKVENGSGVGSSLIATVRQKNRISRRFELTEQTREAGVLSSTTIPA